MYFIKILFEYSVLTYVLSPPFLSKRTQKLYIYNCSEGILLEILLIKYFSEDLNKASMEYFAYEDLLDSNMTYTEKFRDENIDEKDGLEDVQNERIDVDAKDEKSVDEKSAVRNVQKDFVRKEINQVKFEDEYDIIDAHKKKYMALIEEVLMPVTLLINNLLKNERRKYSGKGQ